MKKSKKFTIIILLLITLHNCEKKSSPELYDFTKNFINEGNILKVTCYEIDNRVWHSEAELIFKKSPTNLVSGESATSIWLQLNTRYRYHGSLSSYPHTNTDYQLIAENDHGGKSSLIVSQTFKTGSGFRYVSCVNDDESWISSLEETQITVLGIK